MFSGRKKGELPADIEQEKQGDAKDPTPPRG